jgi:hypothetical protein
VVDYSAAPLNLAFFTVQALLFRAIMSPAKMNAKLDSNSSLCRHFELAVSSFQEFTLFINGITRQCLHAYWGGRV